jgi:hypothetical protein
MFLLRLCIRPGVFLELEQVSAMETIVLIIITMGALVAVGVLVGKAVNPSQGGCACGLHSCGYASECKQSNPIQNSED